MDLMRQFSFSLALLVLMPISFLVGSSVETFSTQSPNGKVRLTFTLLEGVPYYEVQYAGSSVIRQSRLGLKLLDGGHLARDFHLVELDREKMDETWEQPWGEARWIRNQFSELQVSLKQTTGDGSTLNLIFRAYDDGIGFRYEIPAQEHLAEFQIIDELTEFVLAGNYTVWWIPAYQKERYEYLYARSPVSEIDTVHTPLTMKAADNLFLSIHEAALTDYASMTLANRGNNVLKCDLVPWSDGIKVKGVTPFVSPWRTIQISESAGDLITSYLILNLNNPNQIDDVSWLSPGKYIGIWWGMHIGRYTWGSGQNHGATTERAKQYIDFAAEHGFDGVLVEGWNTGWDGDWTSNGEIFHFTRPYDDFDLERVSTYARSKNVRLIGHHETGAGIHNYERQMEDAFALYRELGIDVVKTGYVGWGQGITRIDENGNTHKEWHHGQWMVRHYRKVVEQAARYHIMLDVHEPVKDTGIRRTYPNMMTREGARGQEYNAWSPDGGNPPEHTTILPFTRLLAGPLDFTPGIFDILFAGTEKAAKRVNTTLAKQLALYVIIYSPLHMAADLIENYIDQPAFKFIVDVPTDWEITKVYHAEIGDVVTIVRKDRRSDDWYLGSLTDENARILDCPLDFLDEDKTYVGEIYADGGNADWRTNPLEISISKNLVNRQTTYMFRLAPGGGHAVRFRPANRDELETIQWFSK